jgi:hypothetical protein
MPYDKYHISLGLNLPKTCLDYLFLGSGLFAYLKERESHGSSLGFAWVSPFPSLLFPLLLWSFFTYSFASSVAGKVYKLLCLFETDFSKYSAN